MPAEWEKQQAVWLQWPEKYPNSERNDRLTCQMTMDEMVLRKIRFRMEDINDLIAEKAIYPRIDENARRVLTEIGINIIENQSLMDLLMEADAVDFDNETALFIPFQPGEIFKRLRE